MIISMKEAYDVLNKLITSTSERRQIILVFREIGIENVPQIETIYKSREVTTMFACCAWLVMDINWSVRRFFLEILTQVITSFKAEDRIGTYNRYFRGNGKLKDEELIERLLEFLKDKKYLIVINDIKSLDLLIKLSGALPVEDKGGRVVITTPDEGSASFAYATSRFHYRPLNKEDSLERFIKKVLNCLLVIESQLSDEIVGCLKEKIADICRGNPLRIELLAWFLSTKAKKYEDWSRIDKQLDFATKSPSFDILAFCYNDLPLHLKPCFLYLGLFHKGFEIPVRRLLRLWLAEGFVEPIQGSCLEDTVEAYLEELVQRNMVEISKRRSDESPKNCRMIGSLHDIFKPIAVKIGLFHLHQKSNENSNVPKFGVRRVVECANIKHYNISEDLNYLQSYVSLNNRKKDAGADDVGNFLTRMIGARGFGLLKVLDLEEVDRPRLPKNLGNLFHLRYLGLRYTFLKTLPSSIGALLHLQTLDIKHTQITTVPSSIWSLMRLRHLCLNGARLDTPLQQIEQHTAPSQLQTLQGLFLDENTAEMISSTLERMTNLRKLDLTIESSASQVSSYRKIDSWISSLSSLQSLRLRSMDTKGQPSKLNMTYDLSSLKNISELYLLGHLPQPLDWYKIPYGVKVLTLSVSQLKEDPMPTLSKLSNLIVLRLLATSYEGKEMRFPADGFPALQVLKLWKLEKLERLTVEEGTMQKLHTFEIRRCKKLKRKEVLDNLLRIKALCKLILTHMSNRFFDVMFSKSTARHYRIVADHLLDDDDDDDDDDNEDPDITQGVRRPFERLLRLFSSPRDGVLNALMA